MISPVAVLALNHAASFVTSLVQYFLAPLRAPFKLFRTALDLRKISAAFIPYFRWVAILVLVTCRSTIILSWVFEKVMAFILIEIQLSLFQFASGDALGS